MDWKGKGILEVGDRRQTSAKEETPWNLQVMERKRQDPETEESALRARYYLRESGERVILESPRLEGLVLASTAV